MMTIRARLSRALAGMIAALLLAAPALAADGPKITVKRTSLGGILATAEPPGGRFVFRVRPLAEGDNPVLVKPVRQTTPRTNPNRQRLIGAGDSGSPAPGSLSTVTAIYATAAGRAVKRFKVPTFGMSCYYTTAEDEWGSPPSACESIRINGVTFAGSVKNPYGLKGTYCSAFIAMVRLQGSAKLNSGQLVQYVSPSIVPVDVINGADGTPVIPMKTVARDRSIIPRGGVKVDLAGIGRGLVANDTGGAILGYRIDHYRGYGASACAAYSNRVVVGACRPANAACPGAQIR